MIRAIALSLLLPTALLQWATAAPTKPNILFILADDLGYGDVSGLNPTGKIRPPNLDRILREGMHFTDAHSKTDGSTAVSTITAGSAPPWTCHRSSSSGTGKSSSFRPSTPAEFHIPGAQGGHL